ncbi:MAG: GAF domain-containing sensor histidine kinase [Anaerolineae bacterium]|nr:GAF domain-containing sensor histidine kinase [Anaerolineae bacterium]
MDSGFLPGITPAGQEEELNYFGRFIELASYRNLDEMLAEALSLVIRMFRASAGSLLFVHNITHRVRQGDLEGVAAEQIDLWEDTIQRKLAQARRRIYTPRLAPITLRNIPQTGQTLLNTPLLSQTSVIGSLSLVLPATTALSEIQKQTLSRFVRGVGNLADLIELLTLTQRRLSQLGLFYQMGQAMVSTFDLRKLLRDTMQLAANVIDAGAAVLMLIDEKTNELVFEVTHGPGTAGFRQQRVSMNEGVVGWVASHGEPVIINNVAEDPRFNREVDTRTGFLTQSVLCVPLQIKGKTIGVLEVLNKFSGDGFDEEDLQVALTMAAQAAIAIENARLYQSLREERDRIIEAQEEVRKELARNLHDGTVQLLAAIAMGLDHVERLLKVKPDAVYAELEALRKLTRQAMRDARLLLFEIRPVILESRGLVSALQAYVDQLRGSENFLVHLETDDFQEELDSKVAGTIFSIVQEAVNNVKKHARARNVWIRLHVSDEEELVVSVEDDGLGFSVTQVESEYDQRGSFGLLNMRERAELIDGRLEIESSEAIPNQGTTVTLRVPLYRLSSRNKKEGGE